MHLHSGVDVADHAAYAPGPPAGFSLETATPAARVYQDQVYEQVVGRLSLDAQDAHASGPSSDNAGHNSS